MLAELSWDQLVDHLKGLNESHGEEGTAEEVSRLVHDLRVHQVELEMQNRELREAQALLEASRARYEHLYEEAPVGYVTLDARGCIDAINLTGASLLGREREGLMGAPFATVAHVQDVTAFFGHLRAVFRDRLSSKVDLDVVTGGQAKTFQLTTSPRAEVDGRVLQCRVTMEDITARRLIELTKQRVLEREQQVRIEAEAANRMKDQFLGIVSHELRTPLTALLGWTRILVLRPGDPALIARGMQVMQRNGEALARLVDDILDVSRIVSGKLGVDLVECDLEPIVQSALEPARVAAIAKKIELNESIGTDVMITGDAQRLQQVVWNLLSNAVKFTPPGGHVDVTLERHAGGVRLVVQDDGRGIDAATMPFIFEHFQQGDSSSTREHGGLGLGLAIAKHLVEAHGGSITAQSEGKGRGATLTVDLPLRPMSMLPPPKTSGSSGPLERGRALGNTKVLVVDDDADSLEMVAAALAALGAEVKVARSTADALDAIVAFVPDALVSDVAMPIEDGYDLIRRVRSLPAPIAKVPAIALTAYTRKEDAREAMAAGFTRHVAKPVDLEELADTIADIIASDAGRQDGPPSQPESR